MRTLALGVLVAAFMFSAVYAEDAALFKDKTVQMIIPSAPGGGTDLTGRLLAAGLSQHLPGNPTVIVRNIPGASGITALNYFVERAAPDGLTIVMGSSTQSDPAIYRVPQAKFDTAKFIFIGGADRGGTALVINSAAADQRLLDKAASPVVMGVVGAYPRSGMQTTAWGIEFLGWNARWVMGYPGTNDLIVALQRGEVDMTSTSGVNKVQILLDTGKFKVLAQSGGVENGRFVPRSEFGKAPVFFDQMEGKIKDPLALKAFQYWSALTTMDKWLALPPNAPQAYVDAYRKAFAATVTGAEFKKLKESGEGFEPMSHGDLEQMMTVIGATPQEAIDYIAKMVERQTKKE